MEKEYYIVALNNNNGKNPMKLDNIIKGYSEIDLPNIEEEYNEEIYDSIEILAIKSIYCLKDIITGEVMVSSLSGISNGLSYYKCIKASENDIIRITNKYKKMSKEDIIRYKNAINEIKDRSIKLFNEDNIKKMNLHNEGLKAREYLKYIGEYGI